ncbi:hypothetical protein [Chitinophaga solisilvae]|uniref:hypothetical protein n=1 Tax=Chitinophaga solisilvae TaxID=1233460 RepID=UPI00136EFD3B|nr:hypothetical protein [Chitinophaga solisilvae]
MPNKLLPMYTMKQPGLLAIVMLFLVACHTKKEHVVQTAAAPPTEQDAATNFNTAANSGDLIITEPCAVFYSPDTAKLEKLKKENGEEAFYSIADDNINALTDSRTFLDSKGVKIVDATTGKITFRMKDGSITTINLQDEKYGWEVLLFNGHKVTDIDIANVEKEYDRLLK